MAGTKEKVEELKMPAEKVATKAEAEKELKMPAEKVATKAEAEKELEMPAGKVDKEIREYVRNVREAIDSVTDAHIFPQAAQRAEQFHQSQLRLRKVMEERKALKGGDMEDAGGSSGGA
ncbi:unnamed protein product [Cuscuta campestris]|uniref:Uncharacterized protein n=1 Tax=Cuscuta campestris TaxID=132261 RepID=A0A484N3H5_9ASTE|nr:unnamed protein product [Cuscuta campestris]